ncbi:MAG: M56 family metallopeptidase [Nitrospirota bacterium]
MEPLRIPTRRDRGRGCAGAAHALLTMDISLFFNGWPGMYLAQSFLHSLIAALIVDTALIAWKIEDPVVRQRFRLLVLIVPILSFPLYQLLSPERGSSLFRLDALFDLDRWLDLEIWGVVPVGVLFLLFLIFTSVIFVLQEMLPITHHAVASRDDAPDGNRPEPESRVSRALESLPGKKPGVVIIDDEEHLMFSSTGRDPVVYLSGGLVEALSFDELRAALAHEVGHIRRSRRPLMVLIFLLRVIMFYNPIILMEFRRIVQEEEKICDDLAVALTGNREALANALRKFYFPEDDEQGHMMRDSPRLRDRLEEYSHTLLMESRITRLEEPPQPATGSCAAFGAVLATILTVNYYLV